MSEQANECISVNLWSIWYCNQDFNSQKYRLTSGALNHHENIFIHIILLLLLYSLSFCGYRMCACCGGVFVGMSVCVNWGGGRGGGS